MDADWAKRYGRPVRLASQPSHPATRLKQAGADARRLLEHIPPATRGPRADVLRQIMVQNFLIDTRGNLRPRGALGIVSPYDPESRRAIRGNTRWSGYLVHVTETCDADDSVNLITDVATTTPTRDSQAMPDIHARLHSRRLLPAEHLVDGGYVSAALLDRSARDHQVQLVGPVKASGSWQEKQQTGFTREAFDIDFDRRRVTCPNGQTSERWFEPPAMTPYTVVRFAARQCDPCPDRSLCARGASARTVNFLPRHLHELQAHNRTAQHDSQWRRRYAARSGVEGTICEFVSGHRARRGRYHGVAKTHVQHVLTAIAINLERLATHAPPATDHPRPLTAFQLYLDARDLTWESWWQQGK
ncbi:transposase [Streptomyces sp. NPDC056194]|uniref:transposase n=1 Tax=unclassified Streptomyces TaxID=2593676 RepID=UPI0035DC8EA6